jgi:hypothetical protein
VSPVRDRALTQDQSTSCSIQSKASEKQRDMTSVKAELLRQASRRMLKLSEEVITRGFDFKRDLEAIDKIYGTFDPGSRLPISDILLLIEDDFVNTNGGRRRSLSNPKLSEAIAELFKQESFRLLGLYGAQTAEDIRNASVSSLMLPHDDPSRVQRYETHLSRELERTINQLRRIQYDSLTLVASP